MRAAWKLAPFLLALLLVAGCVGGPQETGGGGTTTTTPADGNASTTPATSTPPRVSGFLVEDLRILPVGEDALEGPLHEDDQARVTYRVVNPGTEGGTTDFLVSYIRNGEVEDVQTVRLAPGDSKEFEHLIEDLRDLEPIRVEVRAGSERASAEAEVKPWPRTTERVDLGPIAITVHRWLRNTTDGWTDVNVTVERKAEPEGNYSFLRVRALCADATGAVTSHGEARPNVPEFGSSAMTDIHVPGCEHTIYGVEVTALDGEGEPLRTRILFVDRGWRPPA